MKSPTCFIRKIRILASHFQTKLLMAFMLCTLIPLGIIGLVSYSVSYSIARDKIMDSATLAADQLHVQLNERIRQADNVADAIQYNMYSINSTSETDLPTYLESLSDLRNNISLYKLTFDFYHICLFLKEDQFGSKEGLYFYPLEKIKNFGITNQDLSNLGASSLWLYRPDISLPFILNTENNPANTAICCRAQQNQGTRQLDYAYFILIDASELSRILASSFTGTDIISYLLTPDGQLAAASDSSLTKDMVMLQDFASIPADSSSYFEREGTYCYALPLDNGWYQITEIPESYITSGTIVLLRTILITLLATLPVTLLVILLISRNLSGRLNRLSTAMEQFRLHAHTQNAEVLTIPHPLDADFYDEIDNLGLTFEQMQETIQKNLRSILDLSLAEERLKYQLLQSQINPHFLYNILGSIRTCQTLGKMDIANQMITDLTRFYRLKLRKSGELVSLRDELEIATLYLNMENLCHNNSFHWEFNLEDGIENFMICKFTLQPFLENSILHGISNQTPDLQLRISAIYGSDTVIITIEDNGAGIPEDKLHELQQNLKNKTVSYEKHFGICNVNARISSELYGCGHITIDSLVGQGTRITIEFAQIEADTDVI